MTTALLLLADTTRSSAYAQAVHARGMDVRVVLYGAALDDRPGRGNPASSLALDDGPVIDPAVPVADIVATAGWASTSLPDVGVNSPEVHAVVVDAAPEVVLFSGHGGELVRDPLLSLGADVLHVHAGRLPGYRGSTTPYYMLLDEGRFEVTAILLTAVLDAGAIVGRRSHGAPPAGTDIDHVLDPVARAHLAADVLHQRISDGSWGRTSPQPVDIDRPYHVIHPVLKHLAVLGLPEPQS